MSAFFVSKSHQQGVIMRTSVRELKEKIGQEVKLYLTLETLRDQKHLQFILGKDKSGTIQLVISKSQVANHEDISTLLPGSAFIVIGKAIEATQSKTFGIEIQVESLEIVSKAEVYPIAQESAIDLRFDNRAVDLRFPRQQLMLKIRGAFMQACREHLIAKEYTEISSPRLLGTASESGSQVFKVDYFDQTAYLAQSPQFYKQIAVVSGLEGVFDIGSPIFRAENSVSTRHLTEFTGVDVEVAWIFSTMEIMKIEEEMIVYALGKLEPYKEEVKSLFGIELLTKPSIHYMTLDEAKEILKEHKVMSLKKKEDLPDEGERMLYEIMKKDLIFISEYPIEKRPFYHKWNREKGTTDSFDLIFRGIEITSGAVREENYAKVCEQATEKGLDLDPLSQYLQAFKAGAPVHAGFGIGLERIISRLLGITVKESSMFPRDPARLTP